MMLQLTLISKLYVVVSRKKAICQWRCLIYAVCFIWIKFTFYGNKVPFISVLEVIGLEDHYMCC